MRKVDYTGRRFGRLLVLRFDSVKGRRRCWLCLCDCGKQTVASGNNLQSGNTVSCGCLHAERFNNLRHGAKRRSGRADEYTVWTNMIQRCTNPKAVGYENYGGRGITVCERWMKFKNFFADMGPRPAGLTIERKNNNGNYEPGNCKWATWFEQANNKRPRTKRKGTACLTTNHSSTANSCSPST